MNEVIIFSVCMVLLTFTPAFNIDPRPKERIGYLIPYLIFMCTSMNLLLQVHAIWW